MSPSRPRRALLLLLVVALAATVIRLATADTGGVYDPADAR
ncbi:hypothetical protein [Aeromicrobium alkaliterrae]|uniref:Uncharacterized protein n=1 Tax=Aeromicrobium alkaliterrae TaxID=302168 RepID=A0ABN2JDI4_9ACTN